MNISRQKRLTLTGWGIPLGYAVITLIVGMTIPRIEHYVFPNLVSTISASAAMSVCSSIASGMIALTGIVVSMAFLMVQFSATAYSPRLVLWIARDPVMSHSLGVFSSTFLYALVLLAWVDRASSAKVPLVSGWLVFVLLLASMGMFIALVHRLGLLQVNRMLVFTGNQGREAISELYLPLETAPKTPKVNGLGNRPASQTLVHVGRPQVVQAVRTDALANLAAEADAVIEVVAVVGDTVLEKTLLLRVYSAGGVLDEKRLGETVELGEERTFEQDPKYALRLLVDIAIKALSPAINDPTTAVQAMDQIEDMLLRLGLCRLEIGELFDSRGRLRLIVPYPTWEDFLLLALDEIRACGAQSVQVMRRMKALINNLIRVLPAERHPALRYWERRLQATVARSFDDAEEKQAASVADRQGLGIGSEESGASEERSNLKT